MRLDTLRTYELLKLKSRYELATETARAALWSRIAGFLAAALFLGGWILAMAILG